MELLPFLGAFVAGALAHVIWNALVRREAARQTAATASISAAARPPGPSGLYDVVARFVPHFDAAAHPNDLTAHPQFAEGVEAVVQAADSEEGLLGYVTGDNAVVAVFALEALARPPDSDEARARLLRALNPVAPWTRYFVLRALDRRNPPPAGLIGPVLERLDATWTQHPSAGFLLEFVRSRLAAGEAPALEPHVRRMNEAQARGLESLLRGSGDRALAALADRMADATSTLVDRTFLEGIGRIWNESDAPAEPQILEHPRLSSDLARLEAAVRRDPPRSVVLVGEPGVGKTAIVRALARRLQSEGWTVFEAGHAELIAGMVYVGQLEERLQGLVRRLGAGRRILWVVPDFHQLLWAGRHRYGPMSALDFVLPFVERGQIVLLGETHPASWERLAQEKPRVLTALEAQRVDVLPEGPTRELVDAWAAPASGTDGVPRLSPEVREEALHLARQFLADKASPGNILQLLELTRRRLDATPAVPPPEIRTDDLIATLGHLTGLPASILDDRQGLDLAALRAKFERRVLGQPEAREALVERVALIKAGLTDPNRPLGVFLFVGPTGTGKTEIAKTLAEFLFGSPHRMIRLDMSEFQAPESLSRILGEQDMGGPASPGGALVDLIRKQPFSVVLLDEFEKANPNVWDLFLQVFDDGRLTDRRGSTADFRHALIIVTSNLGGVTASGTSLGFTKTGAAFSAAAVERAVRKAFRAEFLNRIDRVVVFRPLGRETMREILRKELAEAFERRGLRNRNWAVEWDASALAFLLEKGFTLDLGARPLKRAVERYLLAPLSLAIVDRRTPEGDQFLLVRAADDRLVVEFVDPDAPEPAPAELPAAAPSSLTPRSIAYEASGVAAEIERLSHALRELGATVSSAAWSGRKAAGLERTRAPGFWDDPERFSVLGRLEYTDRVEVGVEAAASLLARVAGGDGRRRHKAPRDVVRRLGEQIWLLEVACEDVERDRPVDAYLLVESDGGEEFARRVGAMYRGWARRRRMTLDVLADTAAAGGRPYRLVAAVSGFGAHTILSAEDGLHVLEAPEEDGRGFKRSVARVRIAPQPDGPPPHGRREAVSQAESALAGIASASIVRRYRERPSPLVRDAVRGWRTGHLDRVLGGDFDLVS